METKVKISKTLAGASAAIAIIALSGCMSTSDRSAGRVLDDKMIASKVKSALNNTPVYKFDDVKVATYKGVVQLSGFVDTPEQKAKAGELTKRVDWVREVVNNISIKPHDDMLTPTGRGTGERSTDRSSSSTTYTTPSSTAPSATYSTPSSASPSSSTPSSSSSSSSSTPSSSSTSTNSSSIHSTDRSTNP
jgi:hyperosmotically inducible protein